MSEKADAHSLFRLTVANDGQMPIKMYIELDLAFLEAQGAKCRHVNYKRTEPGA